MKKFALLALVSSLSSFAAEEFGGLKFHSTVEESQIRSLKGDLRYLYKNPTHKTDKTFLALTQLNSADGPSMHNWLLNRVRYIYGEKFKFNLEDADTVVGKFPATPLPDLPPSPRKLTNEDSRGVTVMSNLGGPFYVIGKMYKFFIALDFDGEKVFVTSPRMGILQVGRGLFAKEFRFNKDVDHASNSVSRLATLFHEARHSDGNGKSTLFMHTYCPTDHWFAGAPACETSGNGPYTIGALAQRQLLQNCKTCSVAEKTALTAGVADSFSRVLEPQKKSTEEYKQMISIYTQILLGYEKQLKASKNEKSNAFYRQEIKKLKDVIAVTHEEQRTGPKIQILNPAPEGTWTPVSLVESKKLMEKSLKKK